jgi:hypothetical protein
MTLEPVESRLKEHLNEHFQEELAGLRESLEGNCKTPLLKLQLELYLARRAGYCNTEIQQYCDLDLRIIDTHIKGFCKTFKLEQPQKPKPKPKIHYPKFEISNAEEDIQNRYQHFLQMLKLNETCIEKLSDTEISILALYMAFGNFSAMCIFLDIGQSSLRPTFVLINTKLELSGTNISTMLCKLGIADYTLLTK